MAKIVATELAFRSNRRRDEAPDVGGDLHGTNPGTDPGNHPSERPEIVGIATPPGRFPNSANTNVGYSCASFSRSGDCSDQCVQTVAKKFVLGLVGFAEPDDHCVTIGEHDHPLPFVSVAGQ